MAREDRLKAKAKAGGWARCQGPKELHFVASLEFLCRLCQGRLFWLFEAAFKCSSGSVEWCRSTTDFDNSVIVLK